jgi:hypothetical protein
VIRNFVIRNFVIRNFVIRNFVIRNFVIRNFVIRNFVPVPTCIGWSCLGMPPGRPCPGPPGWATAASQSLTAWTPAKNYVMHYF